MEYYINKFIYSKLIITKKIEKNSQKINLIKNKIFLI